jgi:hypothetical protein
MLKDYFLKFPSKQEAIQVFSKIPNHTYILDGDEETTPIQQSQNFAIDVVGILYEDDAVYSEDGTVITPPTEINGYHYNYRVVYGNKPEIPLPSELEPYLVTPENPQRTFF